jgi:hypothetical protein
LRIHGSTRGRKQREQRQTLATRDRALAYLGLTLKATSADVMKAFRQQVKAASDNKNGGYTMDMDFLVKVRDRALR